MQKYGAEFFGTFWLVIGGCGSAVLAAAFPNVGTDCRRLAWCGNLPFHWQRERLKCVMPVTRYVRH